MVLVGLVLAFVAGLVLGVVFGKQLKRDAQHPADAVAGLLDDAAKAVDAKPAA